MLKTTFIVLFSLLFSLECLSADVFWTSRLEGSSISAGAAIQVKDANFSLLGLNLFTDADAQSFVRLGLKEEQSGLFFNGQNLRIVVSLKITPYDNTGGVLPDILQTLEVKYVYNNGDPSVDAEDFRMPGIHKFTASVEGVTIYKDDESVYAGAVPNYIYLEGGFSSQRYFRMNTTQLPVISRNYIEYQEDGSPLVDYNPVYTAETTSATDELELTWDYVEGAEYYDLEWCWVDNYSDDPLVVRYASEISLTEQEFAHNSTRIRTSAQSYRLPQVFGRGYLIYRVRGVGRWETDVQKDKYGRWSSDVPGEKLKVNEWMDMIIIGAEHEGGKNWQYQSTYAEEGKKKEVVQYFDGSLRGRQTVTRINSDNRSVVGETIYDNEGRGVIQVLPVPQVNPEIRYYPSFNKNLASEPYSHLDFDWEEINAPCEVSPAQAIRPGSGAGDYYSADAHVAETDWQRNVPDAQGYPYTQVEYTPDNTGRIRNQSGVGETHRIGGGKETYYYYLQPSQEELNRLFGYKVGFKTRYKKNMVVDANGQVSVSYLDAQGRVIATALAGEGPAALDALASQAGPGHGIMLTDLLGKLPEQDKDTPIDDNNLYSTGRFGAVDDGLEMGTQLGVVKDGTVYNFEYHAKSFHYQAEGCDDEPGQAFPFVYDVKLSLRDDCGNEKFTGVFEKLGNQAIGSVTGDEDSFISGEVILDQGSYTLMKEITVNQEAMNAYVAAFLDTAQNPCLLDTTDFMDEILTDCNTTCQECEQALGTEAAFLEAQRIALGTEALTPEQNAEFTNLFKGLRKACIEPCEVKTTCDASEGMLRADLRPMGQYGRVPDPESAPDVLSVFNETNNLGGNWHTPASPYTDEYGNISYVEVQYDGTAFTPPLVSGATTVPAITPGQPAVVRVLPQFLLSGADFAAVWKDSWSLQLLHLHPEYRLYLYQLEICNEPYEGVTSEDFDAYFRDNVHTYAQATGSNSKSINFTDETTGNAIMSNDPYFATAYPIHEDLSLTTLKNALMNEALTSNYDGKNTSMLNFAIRTVVCGTDLSGTCNLTGTWSSIAAGTVSNGASSVTITDAQRDAIWVQYKSYYLSYKLKINQLLMDLYGLTPPSLSEPGIYNGCIGPEAFSFQLGGSFVFSAQFSTVILPKISNVLITLPAASGLPPTILCGADFDGKERRIIRIDNLYNSGIPPAAEVAEQVAAANYAQWQQTGLCPMTASMEALLDKLARTDQLMSEVDSDLLPELTRDLYIYLTDVSSPSGRVSTDGYLSGTSLKLRIGNTTENCEITIPPVGPYAWSNYNSTWNIYGVYHSYAVPGTNTVKVIMKAGPSLAEAVEYVVTYTSCKNLNACQADYQASNAQDADCGKEERLEADLLNLFQALLREGKLHLNHSLSAMPEYMQSGLVGHLGAASPVWNGAATINSISTGSNSNLSLGMNFPGNTAAITAVEMVGDVLYIQIITTLPAGMETFTTTPTYRRYGLDNSKLNLACPCERETGLVSTSEDMLNHLLMLTTVPDGYVPPMMKDLKKYLAYDAPAIYEFENTDDVGISFALSPGKGEGNLFTLTGSFTGKLTAISDIKLDPAGFTAIGYLPLDISVLLTGRVTGVKDTIPACDTCQPQRAPTLSCDLEYQEYISSGPQKTNAAFLPVTKAVFCEAGYAYISDAWTAYLDAFGVDDSEDELFLTLAEFGSTPIGYSNEKLLIAVNDYVTYRLTLPDYPRAPKTWNEFVDHAYMKQKGICPVITDPIAFPDPGIVYPCDQWQHSVNSVNGQNQERIYLDQLAKAFRHSYIEQAMATLEESFTESHDDKEYHYTLYYYDRAGNLIQTVPPKGVKRLDQTGGALTNGEIDLMRVNEPEEILNKDGGGTTLAPEHQLETIYKYNSLNQLVFQQTPDGGQSRFAYDELGRIVLSQNAKQLAAHAFSYTLYDGLGRVYEAGELTEKIPYMIDDLGRLVLVSNPTGGGAGFGQGWINNIAAAGSRREVTVSVYDGMPQMRVVQGAGTVPATDLFSNYSRSNTRNRIVATLYQKVYNSDYNNHYDALSLYDYDVHGNVKELIQVNADADLVSLGQHVKKMLYDYDLVSGNVKQVTYQKGKKDQFIHRYQYDADNRITDAETSDDGFYFEKDAKYFYYAHGPLARTELGNKKVQAQDYAYTIQGWLKAVNGEQVSAETMMGYDGNASTANSMAGRDVYGYSLSYFQNDYLSAETGWLNHSQGSTNMGSSLYNGNIRTMMTAISDFEEQPLATHHTNYSYDQLNRIKSMTGYVAGTTTASGYSNTYGYDPNGNLKSQTRVMKNTAGITTPLDALNYIYRHDAEGNEINQLDHVSDVLGEVAGVDLADQAAGNYSYDPIGQLLSDASEDILEIKWTVSNKVKEITYTGARAGEKIVFDYDAMGNRIAKHVTEDGVTTSTYYVLDAQGNPMSVYNRKSDENNLYLAERNIYGSSRIGMEQHHLSMEPETAGNIENMVSMDFDAGQNSLGWPFQSACSAATTQVNVSGTLKVTDPCPAQHDLYINTIPGHYYEFAADFDITNASNFFILGLNHEGLPSSCGSVISSQNLNVTTGNRFIHGFTATTTCSRISLRNIGTGASPGGTFTVDNIELKHWLPETAPENEIAGNVSGDKRYELANHLGNVLNVVTDRKLPNQSATEPGTVGYYLANVVSFSDYDPFGMQLIGRHGTQGYRYGFQGQESDDEVKGEGNSLNYKYRMHDPRIGRFFAIDPLAKKYPFYTPYSFSGNEVIRKVEIEGLEPADYLLKKSNTGKTFIAVSHATGQEGKKFYWTLKSGSNSIGWEQGNRYQVPKPKPIKPAAPTEEDQKWASAVGLDNTLSSYASESWNKGNYLDALVYKVKSWDSGIKGDVGFKRKGIPLLAATAGTILTLGTGAAALEIGATGYLTMSAVNGTIGATGNIIGQFSSGAEFDYADPVLEFASGFVPGGFWAQTLASSTSTSLIDISGKDGFKTPLNRTKSLTSTGIDFGFGVLGGAVGLKTEAAPTGIKLFGAGAVEHLNNKTNDAVEKE